MDALRQIASPAILFYSARLPDHPGKWRVVDALLRASRMDELHRGATRRVRRRGVEWVLDTVCWVQRTVYYRGGWDDDELRLVLSVLPPDGVFLDVGAYFGWYSLVVGRARPRGRVFAFEPLSSSHRRFEENRRNNGLDNVTCQRAAVGAAPGEAEMELPPESNGGSAHLTGGEGGGGRERVPVTTLDAFAAGAGVSRVDVVKIDVEGAEPEVLRGAGEMIRRFRPTLLIELNPSALAERGSSAAALLDELDALGYAAWRVGRRAGLTPFGRADLSLPELERGYVNLFCRSAHVGGAWEAES